jgi:DNA-binding transcriptional MerR regulator
MSDERVGADKGVYSIAVAAELVGLGEQTLRLYERRGLLTPDRTAGGTRRYSEDDLRVLRRAARLLEEGLNLAGAQRVIALEDANDDLAADNRALRGRIRGL